MGRNHPEKLCRLFSLESESESFRFKSVWVKKFRRFLGYRLSHSWNRCTTMCVAFAEYRRCTDLSLARVLWPKRLGVFPLLCQSQVREMSMVSHNVTQQKLHCICLMVHHLWKSRCEVLVRAYILYFMISTHIDHPVSLSGRLPLYFAFGEMTNAAVGL